MRMRDDLTHRHDVFVVWGKSHTVDAILVSGELGHTGLVLHRGIRKSSVRRGS